MAYSPTSGAVFLNTARASTAVLHECSTSRTWSEDPRGWVSKLAVLASGTSEKPRFRSESRHREIKDVRCRRTSPVLEHSRRLQLKRLPCTLHKMRSMNLDAAKDQTPQLSPCSGTFSATGSHAWSYGRSGASTGTAEVVLSPELANKIVRVTKQTR